MQVLLSLALAAAASALKAPARGGTLKMMLNSKDPQHTHSSGTTVSLALTPTDGSSVIDTQKALCEAVAPADAVEGASKGACPSSTPILDSPLPSTPLAVQHG